MAYEFFAAVVRQAKLRRYISSDHFPVDGRPPSAPSAGHNVEARWPGPETPLIVAAELTTADGYAERATALEMLDRLPKSKRRRTVAGDKNYDTVALDAIGHSRHVARRRRSLHQRG